MRKTRPPVVSYADALGHASADKRIEILRLIASSGSISQAARQAGVSYKAAWQAIDTLTNLAGVVLVQRVVGGAGGGGALLTEAGRQLLAAAQALERSRKQLLAGLERSAAGALPGRPSALGQLSLRTSMRNLMPCSVRALEAQGPLLRVHLVLADGSALVSRITRESGELLGLAPDLALLVLCKATAVGVYRISTAPNATGRNLLFGVARRVSRGPTGDEVSCALQAGAQCVGFAASNSGIRVRSRVALAVDEAALVLALAG